MPDNTMNKRVVSVGSFSLEGFLRMPPNPIGLVVFAHGAGSSHLSTRNNFVAEELGKRGIATLLFDLLTEEEATNRANVFDITLLSARMREAVQYVRREVGQRDLPMGLFGSSTGAAAALVAAAEAPEQIRAIVSRGGRPDMAGKVLPKILAPVLLIVGGADTQVIELNEAAARQMTCPHKVEIVPGATHLFAEPGTLEEVVRLAGNWFETYFQTAAA